MWAVFSDMKLPQLSLRDLFWLVALVAMGCGWWVERRRHANDAEAMRHMHGMISALMERLKQVEAQDGTGGDYSGYLFEVIEDPPKEK
jgi:hypothetical protein